jgi:hypothetical protein
MNWRVNSIKHIFLLPNGSGERSLDSSPEQLTEVSQKLQEKKITLTIVKHLTSETNGSIVEGLSKQMPSSVNVEDLSQNDQFTNEKLNQIIKSHVNASICKTLTKFS